MEGQPVRETGISYNFRESISNTRINLLQATLNSMEWEGRNANILVVGLSGAGKSTFLEFLDRGAVINKTRKPTLSFSRLLLDFGRFKMVFIDAPGQKAYWQDWTKYLPGSDGIIFMIDSANFLQVRVINGLIYNLLKLDNYHKPVVFMANKQDLASSLEGKSIDNLLGLSEKLAASKLFEISAINGNGIMNALKWLLTCIKNNN